jgi:hypothetical protein
MEITVKDIMAGKCLSEEEVAAIDLYYGYTGSRDGHYGPKSDEGRKQWMDWKDQLKKQDREELASLKAGFLGFTAAAVMFTPFGWLGALGVGAYWGYTHLKSRKARAIRGYARVFFLNSQGVVVDAIRLSDPNCPSEYIPPAN